MLNLEKDYDPQTRKFLKQPDENIPEYQMTENVCLNIIADYLYDIPVIEDSEQAENDLSYLIHTKASIFCA